jgi:hypothetical protein
LPEKERREAAGFSNNPVILSPADNCHWEVLYLKMPGKAAVI